MKRRIAMYNRCVCIDCCSRSKEYSTADSMKISDAASISYTISIC